MLAGKFRLRWIAGLQQRGEEKFETAELFEPGGPT